MNILKKIYSSCGRMVHTPYAMPLLAFLFFIEAIFFIPVDPILIVFCIEKRHRSLLFALIATCASVAGGLAGYYIGYAIWETIGQTIIAYIISPDRFEQLIHTYTKYESWAVLIAGFTPLPYKAVTLTAGFCKLPLMPFIICSFIARGARFFCVGTIIYIWGETIKEYIDQHFNLLVGLFATVVMVACWLAI